MRPCLLISSATSSYNHHRVAVAHHMCSCCCCCMAVSLIQRPSLLEASAATQQGGNFHTGQSTAAQRPPGSLLMPAFGRRGTDSGPHPSVLTPIYCSAMPWVECTALRYHCTRHPDINLCPDAYAEGRFPPGCSSRDFIRLEGGSRTTSSDGWRPEETML